MNQIITGLMIGIAGVIAMITGGVPIAAISATPLASAGIWEALGLLSNIIAPIVGALVAVIVWLHKRINDLEESQNDLDKSVFGSEKDALNEGVLIEVRNLDSRLDQIQQSVEEIRDRQKKLEEYED